jgi:hypothetical protein
VFNTARSYRDTLQSSLPSYRERIAQVFLKPDEGGLNLNMPEATVRKIVQKGADAGELLLQRYSTRDPATGAPRYTERFREHVWVRLYVLFGQLEKELANVTALGPAADLQRQLLELVDAQARAPSQGQRPWYLSDDTPAFTARAKDRAKAFLALVEEYRKAGPLFSTVPPSPEGMLRVTPEV